MNEKASSSASGNGTPDYDNLNKIAREASLITTRIQLCTDKRAEYNLEWAKLRQQQTKLQNLIQENDEKLQEAGAELVVKEKQKLLLMQKYSLDYLKYQASEKSAVVAQRRSDLFKKK